MSRFREIEIIVSHRGKLLLLGYLAKLDTMGTHEEIISSGKIKISARFPREKDLEPVMRDIRNYLESLRETLPAFSAGEIVVTEVDKRGWEWREEIKIQRVSSKFFIKSPWEYYSPREGEVVVEINPGLSFGLGEHETTRLCIRGMEEVFKRKKIGRVLDVGCGSGVLSICAAKLGAHTALGFDIDPIAVGEAKMNARRNDVLDKVLLFCGGSLEGIKGKFELILANMPMEVFFYMIEGFRSKLIDGGGLVISGVPERRKDETVGWFGKRGFVLEEEFSEGIWIAFLFTLL